MKNGTTNTQFAEALKPFTTALAIIINEFNFADLIKCLSQKGGKLTQFMRLVVTALMEGNELIIDYSKKIINIDRSKPFDPAKFIGQGWEIAEQDGRVLEITEVDLNDLQFTNYLKEGETAINGEERLKRAKQDGRVRLDAAIFLYFWNKKYLIPESWKEKINNRTKFIVFDGTILQDPDGDRCVLYLYWDDGEWNWPYIWLDRDFDAHRLSALLVASKK